MLEFLWDLHQSHRINSAESRLAGAEAQLAQTASAASRIEALETRSEKLALLTQALVELLQTRLGLTEAEILDKVIEIDLRDGRQDGRMGGNATTCDNCQRPYNVRKNRCLYCDHVNAVTDGSLLDRIG